MKKQKWIFISIYRPLSQPEQYFFCEIGKALDYLCTKYENIILIGDFNCEAEEDVISGFMDNYNLQNLVRCPTCFKSGNPRSIDLILTNGKSSFRKTVAIETGLFDFHAMIVTVLKGGFVNRGPKIVTYRDYSKFSAVDFEGSLVHMVSSELSEIENYGAFEAGVMRVLNEHAPVKKKSIRANDRPFMTKALRKEHIHRTRLHSKYHNNKTDANLKAFKKQRNKCVKLLRKAKFDYYQKINLGNLTDNRTFWKTVKPIFSDKVQANPSFTLIENDKMIDKQSEIAEIFNQHFATITDSLGISINDSVLLPTNGMLDSVNKTVRKYDAHPSICKIRENVKITNKFEFSEVSTSDIAVQIKPINSKKASPVDSIPERNPKENSDLFSVAIQFFCCLTYV